MKLESSIEDDMCSCGEYIEVEGKDTAQNTDTTDNPNPEGPQITTVPVNGPNSPSTELVTTDGQTILVPEFFLKAHSDIFRKMLDSDPSRRSIHISASDHTVKRLVALMVDGVPQEFADFGQIKDVLKVCQEYNLDFIARSILPQLRPYAWPFCKEVYAFAAYYDDSDLASNAVYHFHQFFRDETPDKLQLRLKGLFSSEPMLSCKHKYLVALLSVVARIPSGWYTSADRVKEFGMDFRVWQVEIKHFKP